MLTVQKEHRNSEKVPNNTDLRGLLGLTRIHNVSPQKSPGLLITGCLCKPGPERKAKRRLTDHYCQGRGSAALACWSDCCSGISLHRLRRPHYTKAFLQEGKRGRWWLV
ncbi:hypothetical protein J4Q44_G00205010 [Coregonus suidteri]|uniref:Uncharacterized protein n=1 Tax=Coregonus suidteri TaxID=861788 RepID=A0AAN8LER7_9TELE